MSSKNVSRKWLNCNAQAAFWLVCLLSAKIVIYAKVVPHSKHRFPAPSSKEGCRKPVLGVWGSACGDLEWNGRHQAAGVVQNGVQTAFDVVALLCCAVLVLGTWKLFSCSLCSWGCLSMTVFIPHWKRIKSLLCPISSRKMLKLTAQTLFIFRSRLPSMVRCFAHC